MDEAAQANIATVAGTSHHKTGAEYFSAAWFSYKYDGNTTDVGSQS